MFNFKKYMVVEPGTTIHVYATYDNTSGNPGNPNDPPALMTWGERTVDEMLFLPISFVDRDGVPKTAQYLVPQRNQCRSCHERIDTGGNAFITPIGPKARHLHRTYDYGGTGEAAIRSQSSRSSSSRSRPNCTSRATSHRLMSQSRGRLSPGRSSNATR